MKVSSAGILIEMLLLLDLFSSLMSATACEHGWTQCKTTGIFIKNHKCPNGICVPYTNDNGVKMQCCKPKNHECAHCDKKNGDLKCKKAANQLQKDGKLNKETHEVRCNSGCCQERKRVKKQKVSVGAGGGDISFAWTYMWITMFFN